MNSAVYKEDDKNYDDIVNVNRNLYSNAPSMNPDKDVYDDVLNQNPTSHAPNMNPDKGVYDDITNVKRNDILVSTVYSLNSRNRSLYPLNAREKRQIHEGEFLHC